jgi:hypothetical protein
MDFKQVERYKKNLISSVVGLSPHVSRVVTRSLDNDKMKEWFNTMNDRKEDGYELDVRPFLDNAFYIAESGRKVEEIFGIRFQHTDGVYKFAVYTMGPGRSVPSYPKFVFNVSELQNINMNSADAIQGKFDITTNETHPDGEYNAKIFVNIWANINHFMTNFERDVQVIIHKNKEQKKGGGKGRRSIKTITSKTYRCYLPDNWIARNDKEYTAGSWNIPRHWHRRIVNEDFLDRKREELTEDEFNRKYRLSSDQNPKREGKIYVEINQDPTKGFRDEALLSEDATGMKPVEYNI